MNNKPSVLLNGVTAAGRSGTLGSNKNTSFQAFLTGSSGALSATVTIDVSQDGEHWDVAATIELSVASWSSSDDDDSGSFAEETMENFPYVSMNLVSISGADAAVSAFAGK